MASMVTQEQEWSPKKVASWLRRYRDWLAELKALGEGPVSASFDYSRPSVMGGSAGASGGPAAQYAERRQQLSEQVATVSGWLLPLCPAELAAADYYLNDADISDYEAFATIAAASGLNERQTRTLTLGLPLFIWVRHYKQNAM